MHNRTCTWLHHYLYDESQLGWAILYGLYELTGRVLHSFCRLPADHSNAWRWRGVCLTLRRCAILTQGLALHGLEGRTQTEFFQEKAIEWRLKGAFWKPSFYHWNYSPLFVSRLAGVWFDDQCLKFYSTSATSTLFGLHLYTASPTNLRN